MRLAVSTYSLWEWRKNRGRTLEDSIDQIADLGAAGVEFAVLPGEEPDDAMKRAETLRARAEKRGLGVAGYCVGAELLVSRDAQREVVAALKREVDVAAVYGARTMRHDITRGFGERSTGLDVEPTFENAVQWIVPAIREVADYAKTKGIKTSLENHGFFMQAAERVERLLQAVNHENFGLTLDMGNFLCVNDDPVRAVDRLAKYAIMAHAKDFHIRPKDRMPPTGWFATPTDIALRGAIVGHGAIDVPAQLKLLRNAGYDGWLSLEFEGMEDPVMAVDLGLRYLREQLAA